MPRDMGTSTGVNESVASGPPATPRFCTISGMCRWMPPTWYADADPMISLASRFGLRLLPAPEGPTASTDTRSAGSMSPAAMPGWRPRVTAVTLQPGTAMRRAPTSSVRWRPSDVISSGRP